MIQRIQSVWLLLAVIAGAFTFKYPYCTGTWVKDGVQHPQIQLLAYNPSVFVLIVTVVTMVLAFLGLILFKNRKQQMMVTILALLASIGLIFVYYNEQSTHFIYTTLALSSIFTFMIPVFLFFAIRGIYRDMKLVKSVDRLR